jgi:hypothetical protein
MGSLILYSSFLFVQYKPKLNSVVLIQVLDWLANHGEVFLRKNIGIGRNLQKARVYQKSHEHFENVAQVSIHIVLFYFYK